jgi:hypothetical protein
MNEVQKSELKIWLKSEVLRWCGGYSSGSWTPTYTNLTVVGALDTGAVWRRIGDLLYIHGYVTAATSTASTVGVTYLNNLPFTGAQGGSVNVYNATTAVGIGIGYITYAGTAIYLPTWAATANYIEFDGWVIV